MGELKTYTYQQIANAFWDTFHRSGDVWFNYLGSEDENQESTRDKWVEFLDNLTTPKDKRVEQRLDQLDLKP